MAASVVFKHRGGACVACFMLPVHAMLEVTVHVPSDSTAHAAAAVAGCRFGCVGNVLQQVNGTRAFDVQLSCVLLVIVPVHHSNTCRGRVCTWRPWEWKLLALVGSSQSGSVLRQVCSAVGTKQH